MKLKTAINLQFKPIKSFKHKITAECDYFKRTKDRFIKIFFKTD